MFLGRKIEIRPTPTQSQKLRQAAGNARWAFKLNASINILKRVVTARLSETINACGGDVSPIMVSPGRQTSMKQESRSNLEDNLSNEIILS